MSSSVPATPAPTSVSFRAALKVWMRIGLLSFGGPAGQIALMHQMLVEDRKWISNERFLHALNYCHLLPGPEAQQLATYIGWLLHGTKGGLAAGLLFILPGMCAILALSMLYVGFQHLTAAQAFFYGLKPAVLAIVVAALARIASKALKNSYLTVLAAAAFAAMFLFQAPFPLVIFAAGALGYLGLEVLPDALGPRCPAWLQRAETPPPQQQETALVDTLLTADAAAGFAPSLKKSLKTLAIWAGIWLGPLALIILLLGPSHVYAQIAIFFSKMAAVTFGGAYAVLAYMAQEAVHGYGWLRSSEMLDGLALAETTPGPLIQVVQFVGFVAAFRNPGILNPYLAGTLAACLTVWMTFSPCFLWIFVGAPYVEQLRNNRLMKSALLGITAAVVGVIFNLSIWFGLHTMFGELRQIKAFGAKIPAPVLASADWFALVLALCSYLAMKYLKWDIIPVLLGCAVAGFLGKMYLF